MVHYENGVFALPLHIWDNSPWKTIVLSYLDLESISINFEYFLSKRVRNRKNTKFQEDKWTQINSLFFLFPRLYDLYMLKSCKIGDHITKEGFNQERRREIKY